MKLTLCLIVGLPGSGKTGLARCLATRYGACVISTEVLWSLLFNHPPSREDMDFAPHELQVVYQATTMLTDLMLASGRPVVVEGVFRTAASRTEVENIAKKYKYRLLPLYLLADKEATMTRLVRRKLEGSRAPAGPIAYERIRASFEPPDDKYHSIDSTSLTSIEVFQEARRLVEEG